MPFHSPNNCATNTVLKHCVSKSIVGLCPSAYNADGPGTLTLKSDQTGLNAQLGYLTTLFQLQELFCVK
jgi:hypothetical protein